MGMHRLLCSIAASLVVSACAAVPQQQAVKEIRVCDANDCSAVGQKYSSGQLLAGFQRLLKANEGEKATLCDSDPETRACESVGICQFVLGGIVPGNGCATSIAFSDIAPGKQANELSLKADMPLTFIWTPLSCATADATLSVHSPDEIYLEFKPRFCSWMVVGNMSATFNLAVEAFDLNQGLVNGYWSHAVSGGGNGRGSGYAVLKFPKPMPAGENWLAEQPEDGSPVAQSGAWIPDVSAN